MKKILMIVVMGLSIGTSYCIGTNGSLKDQYPDIIESRPGRYELRNEKHLLQVSFPLI